VGVRLLAPLPGSGFGVIADPGGSLSLARLRRARGQPGGLAGV